MNLKKQRMRNVFVGPNLQMIEVQYAGFKSDGNALVTMEDYQRYVLKICTLIGLSTSRLTYPFFKLMYSRFFTKNLKDNFKKDNVRFILYGRIYESCGNHMVRYLRETYKGCTVLCFFGDLIETHKCDIIEVKRQFDDVFTFDEREAERYGIKYCLEPFSARILQASCFKNREKKWDVTFVGMAKNRYKEIVRLYEKLKSFGLKCDFHIVGVKKKDRLYEDEIGYEKMTFIEILERVSMSKCVAEIIQLGGYSPTTRYTEAVLFNVNLLTDCKYFKDKSNRTPNIIYFENIEEITEKEVRQIKEKKDFDRSGFIEMFSVENMIKTIEGKV